MKKLKYVFIDPFIWNNAPLDVVEDGTVVVNGSTYGFEDGEAYPDGTACHLYRSMEIRSIDETFLMNLAIQQQADVCNLADVKRREAKFRAAVEFNRSLNIPVKWHPAIKAVLSGLTAGSNGAGQNRRSVEHVYLTEQFHDGRLHRSANSYLCSPDGKFAELAESVDGELDWIYEVTCKACLKFASRWQEKE